MSLPERSFGRRSATGNDNPHIVDPMAVNRVNWNERTAVHARSSFYDLQGFRDGRTSLKSIELGEIGDVAGKTLLHLQCHFGMDTITWARRGARATGVDFSDAAIELARSLNGEIGTDVRFICSNIYDLAGQIEEDFDFVFTSYGALAWLPDINAWADVVAESLKPGGVFYIIDFHPYLGTLGQLESGHLGPEYNYFHERRFMEGNLPSYTGADLVKSPCWEWQHSLGEIVTALSEVGLNIEFLHEFAFCRFRAFPEMELCPDGWWRFPSRNQSIPQMFSIRARK